MSITDAPSPADLHFATPQQSPDVVQWLGEHTPAAVADSNDAIAAAAAAATAAAAAEEPLTPMSPEASKEKHLERRDVGMPHVASSSRVYNHEQETKARDHLIKSVSSETADEHWNDDLSVQYIRTLVCNAPRNLLWRALLKKIRAIPETTPESAPCGLHNLKILAEGVDYVYRELDVTSVTKPGQFEHIKEKITWDEASESVRCTLYEDEKKSGYIESAVATDASHHVCLTVQCQWEFFPSAELTVDVLNAWRSRIKCAIDQKCVETVKAVEAEARELMIERRRRSITSKEHEEKQLQQQQQAGERKTSAAGDQKEEKANAAATTTPRGKNPAPGTISVRQIQVQAK